jgi:hypothetical protein
MKTSLTVFSLIGACVALAACGGVAPDDVDTVSSELTGIEGEDIDYDDSAATGGASTSGSTYYVGSANGGVWKTTNCDGTGTGGGSTSCKGVYYPRVRTLLQAGDTR